MPEISIIREKLIDPNKFSRPGMPCSRHGAAIHWGFTPGLSAMDWRNRFNSAQAGPRKAGYAYFVAWDGIVQAVPDNEMTYHVGAYHYFPWILERFGSDPNKHLIGVLISHRENVYGEYDHVTLRNAVELLAWKSLTYGWNPRKDILQHSQITGKGIGSPYDDEETLPCPRYFVSNPIAWWDFLKSIEARKVELEIERKDRES